MAELLPLFNSPIESEESEHGLSHKKQEPTELRILSKKLDILSGLTYTDGNCGKPIIRTTTIEELPNSMIAFSKAVSSKSFNHIVHFYEADRSFARIMHNPQMYAKYSVASSTSFLQIFTTFGHAAIFVYAKLMVEQCVWCVLAVTGHQYHPQCILVSSRQF